ncbi:MAG: HhH-GPD-type base excision DNA repair protein [Gaiellaceae bacterium]
MPDALWFTDDEAANRLIADDPFALLVGFALDQQVTVQQAFLGPLRLKERLGTLEPRKVAKADLEPLFREKPAIHRFPGSMAERVRDLAATVTEEYDGDASRLWTEAADGADLRRRIAALPGFGEMKVKSLGAVLAKRFGVPVAQELVPSHPTLGDVDSAQALTDYQAAKKAHKAEWLASKSAR